MLAIPLGMALATGVEAPSNAIAQLPQLDEDDRRRFGRLTLWIMLGIVGFLTIAFAALAVGLGTKLPGPDSTLLAEVARDSTGGGVLFAAFQAASALLLLSAAASSYLAGSGVLKALAQLGKGGQGLVPSRFARINRFLIPEWGIAVVLVAAAILVAAGDASSISSASTQSPSSPASSPPPSPARLRHCRALPLARLGCARPAGGVAETGAT